MKCIYFVYFVVPFANFRYFVYLNLFSLTLTYILVFSFYIFLSFYSFIPDCFFPIPTLITTASFVSASLDRVQQIEISHNGLSD